VAAARSARQQARSVEPPRPPAATEAGAQFRLLAFSWQQMRSGARSGRRRPSFVTRYVCGRYAALPRSHLLPLPLPSLQPPRE